MIVFHLFHLLPYGAYRHLGKKVKRFEEDFVIFLFQGLKPLGVHEMRFFQTL